MKFLGLVLVLCASLSGQSNVLLVLGDDIGVENIGCYQRGAAPPTPNIDALAARGVLFRNYWCNPKCSPTRACINTGRYSFRTLVGEALTTPPGPAQTVLQLSETTLPELLEGSGYAQAWIGKWHLGNESVGGDLAPNEAGWSHYAGILIAGAAYYNWPRTVDGVTSNETTYHTSKTVNDALAWLATAPEPWLLVFSPMAAHAPFHVPPASLYTQPTPTGSNPLPYYKAAVEAFDTEIGRLMASLAPGVLDRTNVCFTADNGTAAPVCEPPLPPTHGKGTPYEGGVCVPLIVAGPIVQGAARETQALAGAVDLFATMAQLCGVTPGAVDGISFVPHLESATAPPVREYLYAEQFPDGQWQTAGFAAIRNRWFKLIRRYAPTEAGVSEEFYNLGIDPYEANNLLLGTLNATQQLHYMNLRAKLQSLRSSP